ncbi:DUF2147 domain-containing protein [Helicobacter sp. 16-1353]|uniref:DUF2147 domain-containing protein n=1 Tax=Helicobacter sp. 16-1353 TaxID=2004996 RepID=UPI0015EF578B|nr:DUF2147 domain-containing protein [Helicobacter sp. 16-1353]
MRILFILFFILNIQLIANCNTDITGYWLSPKDEVTGRTSIVEIIKKDGKYFGYKVVYLDSLLSELDIHNEQYSLRDREVLGSVFIYNLEKNTKNSYIKGRYYDFDIGKTFHLRVRLECEKLVFIISIDNAGMLSKKKIYQYLSPNDVKFYIKNKPEIDFSGIEQ